MSVPGNRAYGFRTPAQWRTCLLAGLAPDPMGGISAPPGFGSPRLLDAGPAMAPAFGADGTLWWCLADGSALMRWQPGMQPQRLLPLAGFRAPQRLAATVEALWAATAGGRLGRFALPGLQLLGAGPPDALPLRDITGLRCGLLALLDGPDAAATLLRLDRLARPDERIEAALGAAQAMAALRGGRRVAVLAEGGRVLRLLDLPGEGAAPAMRAWPLAESGAGLDLIAGDGEDRIALASGGSGAWLLLDGEGTLLARGQVKGPLSGLALRRGHLALAGAAGLQLAAAGGPAAGVLLTPRLHSPPSGRAPWAMLALHATLPPGARLRLRWASSDDATLAAAVDAVHADAGLAVELRRRRILGLLDGLWSPPMPLEAEERPGAAWSLPLDTARGAHLWLEIGAEGAAGAAIRRLRVAYPEGGLVERLPAIYRADPPAERFLRRFLAPMEGMLDSLDDRRRAFAAELNPAATPCERLDWIAAWLDLPWHAALPEAAKRCLLRHAGTLLAQRGTAAALALALRCMFPGAAIRIADSATGLGPVTLGRGRPGDARLGHGVLSGQRAMVLGCGRLGALQLGPVARSTAPAALLRGLVLVELPAAASGLPELDAILAALWRGFVPAGARVVLRWTGRAGAVRVEASRVADAGAPGRLGHGLAIGRTPLGAGYPRAALRPGGLALPLPLS